MGDGDTGLRGKEGRRDGRDEVAVAFGLAEGDADL